MVFAPLKRPLPLTHSTPFALKRLATPPVICLTTPSFHWLATAKSSCGSPTRTPSFANVSSASLIAKAVCTQAFVGTHPTRRHVPPSSGSCSMHTALAPSCAARMAAVYPPGPPPRTATSTSTLLGAACRRRSQDGRALPVRPSEMTGRRDRSHSHRPRLDQPASSPSRPCPRP